MKLRPTHLALPSTLIRKNGIHEDYQPAPVPEDVIVTLFGQSAGKKAMAINRLCGRIEKATVFLLDFE